MAQEASSGPPGLADCTGYVFGHAGLLLLESVEAALEPHRLQMRHVAVMLVLDSTDHPLSQQELSKVLTLDPARMVAIVDHLEQAGYARRRRNLDDRRRYTVTLAARGRKALGRCSNNVVELTGLLNQFLGRHRALGRA